MVQFLTGYFDKLSRKQQSPMLAASAYASKIALSPHDLLRADR
jgi:hypothetical protein